MPAPIAVPQYEHKTIRVSADDIMGRHVQANDPDKSQECDKILNGWGKQGFRVAAHWEAFGAHFYTLIRGPF